MEILKKFYAVTVSNSLYEAVIDGDDDDKIPRLIKKESMGESEVDAGSVLFYADTKLMIGRWFALFSGSGLDIFYGKRNTSNIVALFRTEEKARQCLDEFMAGKRQDAGWKEETIQVLRAIGHSHPHCIIETTFTLYWLIPPDEWMEK